MRRLRAAFVLRRQPLPILEAIALETPIVATRIPGVDEIIVDGEHGLLVEPADSTALGDAIRTLLADRMLARQLAAAGRRRVAKCFTVEAMVLVTAAVYEEALHRPVRRAS